MAIGVVSSLVATLLVASASVAWRNRRQLSLVRVALSRRGTVRVSFAALLRVRDDERYVLIELASRPGFYGPPGGVFKHRADAAGELDDIDFREERFRRRRAEMVADLRGFVPARSLPRLVRWFGAGTGRESGPECLRRELAEELREHVDDGVVADVGRAALAPVRTVVEGPDRVTGPAPGAPRGRPQWQLRHLEVYDLVTADEAADRLRRRLVALGADPGATAFVCASRAEIAAGWCGRALVAPHSAYLVGSVRFQQDPPPMPDD